MVQPLYIQIMQDIQRKIIGGNFKVDEQIPSEQELLSEYGVSRVTLRKAIDGLVMDGYLERIQGKGTFVKKRRKLNRLVESKRVEGFSDVAKKGGFVPSTKVIEATTISSNEKLSEKLGLSDDETKVVYIKRIRLADNVPIMIENNYFSFDKYSGLLEDNLELPLYEILKNKYHEENFDSPDSTLGVTLANTEQSKYLDCSVGFPLFELKTLITNKKGVPIHYGEHYIVSDRYQFKI